MTRVETPWIVSNRIDAADRYTYGHAKWAPVEAVILHYTASRDFDRTTRFLAKDDDSFVSAHFNVARDGSVTQMVSLDDRAWHAGGRSSRYKGRGNVNGRTIGIEMMNLGYLKYMPNYLEDAYGRPFEGPISEHPMAEPEPYWEAYTTRQIASVTRVLQVLVSLFPILKDGPTERVVGHSAVDPARKVDPGPAFPWTYVMQRTFGKDVYSL